MTCPLTRKQRKFHQHQRQQLTDAFLNAWTGYAVRPKRGSPAARRQRLINLRQTALTLAAEGIFVPPPRLMPEHVRRLVGRWLEDGVSVSMISKRLTTLRWLMAVCDRPRVVCSRNQDYLGAGCNRQV